MRRQRQLFHRLQRGGFQPHVSQEALSDQLPFPAPRSRSRVWTRCVHHHVLRAHHVETIPRSLDMPVESRSYRRLVTSSCIRQQRTHLPRQPPFYTPLRSPEQDVGHGTRGRSLRSPESAAAAPAPAPQLPLRSSPPCRLPFPLRGGARCPRAFADYVDLFSILHTPPSGAVPVGERRNGGEGWSVKLTSCCPCEGNLCIDCANLPKP